MNNLNYVDLSTSNEYKNNKDELVTSTENSFGTESLSATSNNGQTGGFFFSTNGNPQNDNKCLLAARTKNYAVVDFMLKNDMLNNPVSHDKDGQTLLHYLAKDYSSTSKASNIADMVLGRKDINKFINVQNKNGDTPAIVAVKAGNMNLVNKLKK